MPSARVESCVEASAAQGSSPWSWASSGSGDAASVRMARSDSANAASFAFMAS